MDAKLIHKKTKNFLIVRIDTMRGEGDKNGNIIDNNQLSEPDWKKKLYSLKDLNEILNYALKIANEVLVLQGKNNWKPGRFCFENDKQHLEFWKEQSEDHKDTMKMLENTEQTNEQILTNLKNILGDDLTNWETKLAKKTDLDQASQEKTQQENQKKQLQKKISELTDQLNNSDNKDSKKEQLEQQIKQLQGELQQANNNEQTPPTSEPSDYQDIKTELEQLREQATNSQDKELMKKIAELTDKLNQRERESKTSANQQNLPSEKKLYWVIGVMGVVIVVLLGVIIKGRLVKVGSLRFLAKKKKKTIRSLKNNIS